MLGRRVRRCSFDTRQRIVDTFGELFDCHANRSVRKVGVTLCRLGVGVAKDASDDWQGGAIGNSDACGGVAQIVKPYALQPRLLTNFVPKPIRPLEISALVTSPAELVGRKYII